MDEQILYAGFQKQSSYTHRAPALCPEALLPCTLTRSLKMWTGTVQRVVVTKERLADLVP